MRFSVKISFLALLLIKIYCNTSKLIYIYIYIYIKLIDILFIKVLYDQNDFNEVLRRADETMSSVRSGFHESSYTNGKYFVITNLKFFFKSKILICYIYVDTFYV